MDAGKDILSLLLQARADTWTVANDGVTACSSFSSTGACWLNPVLLGRNVLHFVARAPPLLRVLMGPYEVPVTLDACGRSLYHYGASDENEESQGMPAPSSWDKVAPDVFGFSVERMLPVYSESSLGRAWCVPMSISCSSTC
jgi:hypothetical protein